MNLYSMADDAVFTNLDVISNLLCADDAVFVDVDIVSNDHFGVSEPALLLDVARPYHTLFTNNGVNSH